MIRAISTRRFEIAEVLQTKPGKNDVEGRFGNGSECPGVTVNSARRLVEGIGPFELAMTIDCRPG
jgi:hypothetical protein